MELNFIRMCYIRLHGFLHSTRLKPVPVHGLFAACAFGILNKELMLSKLVLKELDAFKHDERYIQHIALFNSYYQIFQVSVVTN